MLTTTSSLELFLKLNIVGIEDLNVTVFDSGENKETMVVMTTIRIIKQFQCIVLLKCNAIVASMKYIQVSYSKMS